MYKRTGWRAYIYSQMFHDVGLGVFDIYDVEGHVIYVNCVIVIISTLTGFFFLDHQLLVFVSRAYQADLFNGKKTVGTGLMPTSTI